MPVARPVGRPPSRPICVQRRAASVLLAPSLDSTHLRSCRRQSNDPARSQHLHDAGGTSRVEGGPMTRLIPTILLLAAASTCNTMEITDAPNGGDVTRA